MINTAVTNTDQGMCKQWTMSRNAPALCDIPEVFSNSCLQCITYPSRWERHTQRNVSACCCRMTQSGVCMNDCSGRGTCRQGFCHCKEGYWGRDCLRSKAYAAPAAAAVAEADAHGLPMSYRNLRIYIYDLPWQVRVKHSDTQAVLMGKLA